MSVSRRAAPRIAAWAMAGVLGYAATTSVAAAASPQSHGSGCPPAHGRLYALNRAGAIYAQGELAGTATIYGCLAGAGRRFAVGEYVESSQLQEDVTWADVRRPFAMTTQIQQGPETLANPVIAVYDLRTGRRVRHAAPLFDVTCFQCRLFRVKLGRAADMAWTQANADGSVSVVRVDATGTTTVDRGKVDPNSLALNDSGSTIYWLDGAVPHAAALD